MTVRFTGRIGSIGSIATGEDPVVPDAFSLTGGVCR